MRPLATVSVLSREYVRAPVCAEEDGLPLDPTPFAVEMAFPVVDVDPVSSDWVAASWESGEGPNEFLARALVGPGGSPAVELLPGEYGVWVRVTTLDEVPVIRAGTLEIATTDARRAPIATVGELERILGRPLPEEWQEAAEGVLAMVQDSLETKLGRPITIRTFTEQRTLEYEDVLRISRTPLVRLRSLRLDGIDIDPRTVTLRSWGIEGIWQATAGTGASFDTHTPLEGQPALVGQPIVGSSQGDPIVGFSIRFGIVQIEYDAGKDGTAQENSALKFVVLRAAARELVRAMDDAQGVDGLSIEGYSTRYLNPDAVFTPGELAGVSRHKRRVVL